MARVDTKPKSTPHLWRSAFLMSSVFSIRPEMRKTADKEIGTAEDR